jgi:hypothetical protein
MHQKALTKKVLTSGKSVERFFTKEGYIAENILHSADVESLLIDIMNAATVDFAMMTVMDRRLRLLAQGDN